MDTNSSPLRLFRSHDANGSGIKKPTQRPGRPTRTGTREETTGCRKDAYAASSADSACAFNSLCHCWIDISVPDLHSDFPLRIRLTVGWEMPSFSAIAISPSFVSALISASSCVGVSVFIAHILYAIE
jgi:hypothetical protein